MIILVVEDSISAIDLQGSVYVHSPAVEGATIEGASLNGAVAVTFHALGVLICVLSCEYHIQFSACEQQRLGHIHALGVIAGALDVECAAGHGHVIVGLHA